MALKDTFFLFVQTGKICVQNIIRRTTRFRIDTGGKYVSNTLKKVLKSRGSYRLQSKTLLLKNCGIVAGLRPSTHKCRPRSRQICRGHGGGNQASRQAELRCGSVGGESWPGCFVCQETLFVS